MTYSLSSFADELVAFESSRDQGGEGKSAVFQLRERERQRERQRETERERGETPLIGYLSLYLPLSLHCPIVVSKLL